jgi:hypothetical protein
LRIQELVHNIDEFATKYYVLRYEYGGESLVHADTNVLGLLNRVLIHWVHNWGHSHPLHIDIGGGFGVNNEAKNNKVLYVWKLGHCVRLQLFPKKSGVTREGYTWIANDGVSAHGSLTIQFTCPNERILDFIHSGSPVEVANHCISLETMQTIVTYVRDEIGEREPMAIEVSVLQRTPLLVPNENVKLPGSLSISSNPSFEMALQSAERSPTSTDTSPSS